MYFEGEVCEKCGTRQRYTKTGYCVECHVRRQKDWRRRVVTGELRKQQIDILMSAKFLEEGYSKFESTRPCRICGSVLRYTKNRLCVQCSRLKSNRNRKEVAPKKLSGKMMSKVMI